MVIPTEIEIILRILLSIALGAIIGFQREWVKKPAGLRTHILISVGSCLFTIISISGFSNNVDTARVAAGIVAGVGFLGAGVIFRSLKGDVVVGLTTAASIWVMAGIGMACGVGLYLLAVLVSILTVLVLIIPKAKG